jgi:tetratricopeptide (TPR) repeat protein
VSIAQGLCRTLLVVSLFFAGSLARAEPEDLGTLMARAETMLASGHGADPEAAAAAADAVSQLQTTGDPQLLAARRLLGRVLEDAGRWEEARAEMTALQSSCVTTEDLLGCPEELASVLLKLRRTDEAAALLAGSEGTTRPQRLELLSRIARERGDYVSAMGLASEAVSRRQTTDPIDRNLTRSYQAVGDLEWFRGHFESAHQWYSRAVDQAQQTLPSDHPWRAASLAALGLSEYELGDLASSRQHRTEAVTIALARRGPEHPETIGYQHELANLEQDEGNYPTALVIYQELLPHVSASLPTDWTATFLHNLGRLRRRLGDGAGALEADTQSLALWESALGPDHPYVALATQALGADEEMLGGFASAQAHYERASGIWERRLGPASTEVASALVGAARSALHRGRDANVRDLTRRVESIAVSAPRSEIRIAEVLADLSDLWIARGEWRRAATGFEAAVFRLGGAFGPAHPRVALLRARWARALFASGSSAQAVVQAQAADKAWRSHVRRTTRYLSEGQALRVAAQVPEARDVLLSLALAGRAPADETLDVVVRDRALCLDEMVARQRLLREATELPAVTLRSEIEKAARRLAQLLYREAEEPLPERQAAIALATAQIDSAQQRLQTLGPPGRAASRAEIGRRDVLAALPPRSVMVSFVRFLDLRTPAEGRPWYLAVVTRPRAPTRIVDLGPAPEIDEAIREWRAEIDDVRRAVRDGSLAMRRQDAAGQRLRRLIWDPLRSELGNRLVFIVPDGALNLVAWAGLPLEGGRFLAEDTVTIQLLSTERDLVAFAAGSRVARGRLVALGGPDFNLDGEGPIEEARARRGGEGEACRVAPRFRALPGSLQEVSDLAARWPSADREVMTGRQADKSALRAAAPHATVLHLATHGFFRDAAECGPIEAATALDPLFSVGLALAGANRASDEEGDHDGLLTAAELAGLDLSHTQWAVLSACGSGLGRIEDGEGVLGLRRALAMAGVRTVIMSLADVDDDFTRRLMGALYANRFQRALDTPDALRAAEREMLGELRARGESTHPAYWATFVAVGDWH